jgi:hypothetical protein
MTRVATANANSKAMQDEGAEDGESVHCTMRLSGPNETRRLRSGKRTCGAPSAVLSLLYRQRLNLCHSLTLDPSGSRVMDAKGVALAPKRRPGQPAPGNTVQPLVLLRY